MIDLEIAVMRDIVIPTEIVGKMRLGENPAHSTSHGWRVDSSNWRDVDVVFVHSQPLIAFVKLKILYPNLTKRIFLSKEGDVVWYASQAAYDAAGVLQQLGFPPREGEDYLKDLEAAMSTSNREVLKELLGNRHPK
jgi:hypothetical protein